MTYEEQLASEQSNIAVLRTQLRNIRLPQRTVNWQHRNRSSPVNNVQHRLEVKRQKLRINNQIDNSQIKIVSLRKMILG